MQPLISRPAGPMVAHIAHSTRTDGDLSPSAVRAPELAERRKHAIDHPWRALHQVHSDRVIVAQTPSDDRPFADALVTNQANLVLAVHSGDCVPVGFISDAGAVATAHAGWKGLEAGVLESTVRTLRGMAPDNPASATKISAVVGPHIRKDRYEFGEPDLHRLAKRFGDQVAGTTATGTPALDLTAVIAGELDRLGINVDVWSPDCTARDDDRYWSHRDRQEPGRFALVAWLENPTASGGQS